MTMIRPKIKGLPMTKPPKKSREDGDKIGEKGHGDKKGEFLGNKMMVR